MTAVQDESDHPCVLPKPPAGDWAGRVHSENCEREGASLVVVLRVMPTVNREHASQEIEQW